MRGIKAMTLSPEAIERYLQWCIESGRSQNTVKAYGSDLREFLKAAGENEMISPKEYVELASSWLTLTRQQVSPKTTARRLTSLRGFANWAGFGPVLKEYVVPTPARSQPNPLPNGKADLERMIRAAKNPQQVALVTLGGFVGCRISEALAVDLHNLDLSHRTLLVTAKGDKQRLVPLSDVAVAYLHDAIIDAVTRAEYKLIGYQDRFARQVIKNLGLRAGLQREVASHDLRATYTSLVLSRTNNIRLVEKLLGRSNLAAPEDHTIPMTQMREAVEF